jgi:membrane-associated phospholipid phosphatase
MWIIVTSFCRIIPFPEFGYILFFVLFIPASPDMKRIFVLLLLTSWLSCFSQLTDYHILSTLNAGNKPGWDKGMRLLSETVSPFIPISVASILVHGYTTHNKDVIRSGYKSALSISMAMSISTILKYSIRRQRAYDRYPGDIIQRDTPGTFSFPSGHTTGAFAVATSLTLTYRKWYVAVPAYLYAGMVGYSRMRLGVHYPTDVLGGMALGIGTGLLTWELDRAYLKRKRKDPAPI